MSTFFPGAGKPLEDILNDATSVVVVPTSTEGDAFYTTRVKMDGVDYNCRFAWNTRMERWFVDVYDSESNPIVMGLVLNVNTPLFRYYKTDDRMPPGEMMALCRTPDQEDPGLDDMGSDQRTQLTYYATTT